MRQLLFATANPGKQREVSRLLAGLPVGLHFPDALGLDLEVDESGETFAENALLKARAFSAAAPGFLVAAEDSGLVVPALDGEPGVRSARWGGTRDDRAHNALLLARLAAMRGADRACHYLAALALVTPDGHETLFEGRVDGVVAEAPGGEGGFGYDPLFFSPELGKTFAEASAEEKDRLSHRRRALDALRAALDAMG